MRLAVLGLLALGCCTQLEPRPLELPVDAIRDYLRRECEDQGLHALAVAIVQVTPNGMRATEVAWGTVVTPSGEPRDPAGVDWSGRMDAIGDRPVAVGATWNYGDPETHPDHGDSISTPLVLADLAARAARSHAGSAEILDDWVLVRGSSHDGVGIAVATDLRSASAPLVRVAEFVEHLLDGSRSRRPALLAPIERTRTRELVGHYRNAHSDLEVVDVAGEPWIVPKNGAWMRLRRSADDPCLIVRDRLHVRIEVRVTGDRINLDGEDFVRVHEPAPECPTSYLPYLGTYVGSNEHSGFSVLVLERFGRLRLLEHLTEYDVQDHPDRSDFKRLNVPSVFGFMVSFERDAASGDVALGFFDDRLRSEPAFVLTRQPTTAGTFRIEPVHAPEKLRELAAAATPPATPPDARPFDLVELRQLDPAIHYDIRYASADNFMGFPLYDEALARMQRPAAEAVVRAHGRLAKHGFGLVIHDAWRPWRVTKMFWDATPEHQHTFVADPSKGSRHNRGCAIDLSLYDLATGETVEMPSGYDEFTERAYPYWPGSTGRARALRELLRHAMEDEEFTVYEAEWWHFDFRDWQRYAVR